MAYEYNIPLATDQLSKSQSDIQGNFNALGAIAGNGSTASSSLNGTVGFNFLYLASQVVSIPPITFPAANIGIYSATRGSVNELYVNKTNQATVTQVPITASILSSNSSPGNNSNGWTYTPSGLLLMWGRANTGSTTHGSYQINLPGGFPAFSQVFNIQTTAITNGAADPDSYFSAQAALTGGGQNFTVWMSQRSSNIGNPAYSQFFYFIVGIPVSY